MGNMGICVVFGIVRNLGVHGGRYVGAWRYPTLTLPMEGVGWPPPTVSPAAYWVGMGYPFLGGLSYTPPAPPKWNFPNPPPNAYKNGRNSWWVGVISKTPKISEIFIPNFWSFQNESLFCSSIYKNPLPYMFTHRWRTLLGVGVNFWVGTTIDRKSVV